MPQPRGEPTRRHPLLEVRVAWRVMSHKRSLCDARRFCHRRSRLVDFVLNVPCRISKH